MIDSSVTSQTGESGQKVVCEWLFSFTIKDPYKSIYCWLIQLLGFFSGEGGEGEISFRRFWYVYFSLTFRYSSKWNFPLKYKPKSLSSKKRKTTKWRQDFLSSLLCWIQHKFRIIPEDQILHILADKLPINQNSHQLDLSSEDSRAAMEADEAVWETNIILSLTVVGSKCKCSWAYCFSPFPSQTGIPWTTVAR